MKAIVFVLRGCPAGWLGAYGNEWVATPHLDQLASEGVVFDRHISDCPEPVAASRTLTHAGPALVDSLRSAGIPTVLVRANHPDTDAPDWFYAGWGEVFDARPRADDSSPLDSLLIAFPALLDRLAEVPNYLLWVEIDRLLPPWDVPQEVFEAYLKEEGSDEEEAEEGGDEKEADDDSDLEDQGEEEPDRSEAAEDELEANDEGSVTPWADPPTGLFDPADPDAREWLDFSFAAVVSRLDAELGFLFDALRERGLDRSAVWFVTSDFGLPLGEHGQIGLHRPWLHEELVHLPLFVRLPDTSAACRRVAGFTQPPDVPITLLDYFGIPLPADGQSLLPLARGEAASSRPYAVTTLERGPAAEKAIRTAEWALLCPTRVPDSEVRLPLLFLMPDDRCEMNNVYGHNVDRVQELESLIRTAMGSG